MNDWERYLRVAGSLQRDMVPTLMRMHDEDNLSLLQYTVLQVLDRNEDPTVKKLAALIARSESRTSRIVDQLVRRGLAERFEDATDRRARRIRLAPGGRAYLDRLRKTQIASQQRLWDHMTDGERQVFLHAMEIYAEAARRAWDEDRPAE